MKTLNSSNYGSTLTAFARDHYVDTTDFAASVFHNNSLEHGFWEDINTMQECIAKYHPTLEGRFIALVMAEKIALMHSELSEALEAVRKDPTAPDHHCHNFSNLEIEMADLEIRRADFVQHYGLRNGEAVLAKHDVNVTRPHKHGKQS